MELWDAYDADFQRIKDAVLVRGEAIPEGLFHLVCDILVEHVDGTYLLTQRDYRKNAGGMWEASAGGAALQGEKPFACAVRELKEETGISADNLCELGRIVHHQNHAIYVQYLCITNQDKDSVILQDGETQAYQWVTRDTFLNMPKQKLITDRVQIFM